MRRFRAGQAGDISGMQWRVVKGRKAADDLRLEFRAAQWIPVSMVVGFLMADFLAENETVLYPNARGGRMYLDYCDGAAHLGWEAAADQLKGEREKKQVAA